MAFSEYINFKYVAYLNIIDKKDSDTYKLEDKRKEKNRMRHLVLLAFHFIVCCKPSPLEVAFDSEHPAEFKILINGSPWLKEDLSYGSRIFVRDVHKLRNACFWDSDVINGIRQAR